ncbi:MULTISPECIES: DUF4145 domain-containing protein [Methylorubrum]|uniref:DUF4145 domain-containing protein n=1 Tax=Methylorubrum TaxID=2282523 RepID=UPI00209FA7E2|nr:MULTISPECIES: DUF4145 domain-containing protein [Methylorubrum]MCP1550690.1 hypothetical protein [Methylorubrum zatmanii]MCP1552697.1 hypothetical protein [Methylorubrum extorquens]MCP1580993.1 hypothetical protein [Methylorubrum extorquens]
MPEREMVLAHCNKCRQKTKHDIVHREMTEGREPDDESGHYTWWTDTYDMLECRGCGEFHLRHISSFSEAEQSDIYEYPPRISRSKPEWLGKFPGPFWGGETEIEQLLNEVYAAVHNGSLRLAAIGTRALLEHVMIDKVGDTGTIAGNIKAFLSAGFVAPADQNRFRDKLIEAGHAAMHRGYRPKAKDLNILLDLTEALIASIYVHPFFEGQLEAGIPKRNSLAAPLSTVLPSSRPKK